MFMFMDVYGCLWCENQGGVLIALWILWIELSWIDEMPLLLCTDSFSGCLGQAAICNA
jgi:hypothetical protein